MKLTDRLRRFVGLGPERSMPPPHILAITDGLLITERRAVAWFQLTTANTDHATEEARIADLYEVVRTAERVLAGRELHLKIVFGRISGDSYVEDLQVPDEGMSWSEHRADWIDDMSLPERHVLLGVHLRDRAVGETAEVRRQFGDALTGPGHNVSERELRHLDGHMLRLARLLQNTPWRARPAAGETIAWMVGREQHRTLSVPVPREGTIQGASLAQLTQGRVVPYSDHLTIHDGNGEILAYTAVMAMTEFPEYLTFPGDSGEWLRILGSITRVVDERDVDGAEEAADLEVPVLAEASMRWRVMARKEAQRTTEDARTSAKEQRKSAEKTSAEDAGEEIEETEDAMRQLRRQIAREGVTLAEDHPRIVVTEGNLEDLRAACDAVTQRYAEIGITCEVGYDEQRELWLESLPGDTLRVPDLGHVHDSNGLFGASWWAGSSVGDTEPNVPVVGYLTGTTDGLVRSSLTTGPKRGRASTTLFLGVSGVGKTTGMGLQLLDAAAEGAWVPFLDFKGDAGYGLTETAEYFGIPTGIVEADRRYAGAADLFRILPPDEAVLYVEKQLGLLMPPALQHAAQRHLLTAISDVAGAPNPSSADVIDRLATGGEEEQMLAAQLRAIGTKTAIGSLVVGRPESDEHVRFTTDPGLWVFQVPGLRLPKSHNPDNWDLLDRASLAAFRGFSAWVTHTMGDHALRGVSKLVGLPEVHMITSTEDGASFLDYIARLGRALNGSLVIDTQDGRSIADVTGLVEQIVTVFAFQQRTKDQQQAALELVNLDPDDAGNRQLIASINNSRSGDVRHGHCIMRDQRSDVGTVQLSPPSDAVRLMLDTSAEAAAERYAAANAGADENEPHLDRQEVSA